ncbi:heterokaryon incompatibility protein [Marssonina coronariae]|uniref:Heterokaryon incompatibility protein n=1 Tax=Diplocarpon coronariae TaxID=2795749 RepID=A0A218YZ49_9HELO|nr:heterokaryon incompatibility protein [Marssonina coronariae]
MSRDAVALHLDEIRLLVLRPRSYAPPPHARPQDATIFCELVVVSRQQLPPYTALSYAWGAQDNRRAICVGDVLVNIGSNLHSALLSLRLEQDEALLWVDQLCIDQANEEEKGHQVSGMKSTYASASHVAAWIGPAADGSDLVLAQLNSIGSKTPKRRVAGALTKKSFRFMIDHMFSDVLLALADPETLEAFRAGFERLCQRPYWRRLWVIQEYAVGRKVDVLCGSSRISHHRLQWALYSTSQLLDFVGETGDVDERVRLGRLVAKAFGTAHSSFMDGIVTRRHKFRRKGSVDNGLFFVLVSSLVLEIDLNHPECSDPRDRIFAVLGLADDASSCFSCFPDYSRTCDEVYIEATRRMLKQGHLDILAYCHGPRSPASALPSWVPDWRLMTFAPMAYSPWQSVFFSASGHSQQPPIPDNEDPCLLGLSGIVADTVRQSGSLWSPDWLADLDPGDTLRHMDEIEAFCAQSPRIAERERVNVASCIAIADFDHAGAPGAQNPGAAMESYQRLRARFTAKVHGDTVAPDEDCDTWYRQAVQFFRPCRPFVTRTGYVGLGPSDVAADDVVVLLTGATVPYVVRRGGPGVCVLVGEAYLWGAMYGEAVKGGVTEMFVLR